MITTPFDVLLFGERRLHGVYLSSTTGETRARVLIITPLFEEKRAAHRVLVTCGRAMADAGADVLIPDLSATGNSSGSPSVVEIDHWAGDIRDAAELLRTRGNGPLTVIGCRAGALLAARAVQNGLAADKFILLQPVTGGRHYLGTLKKQRMVQTHLTGDKPLEVGPYEVEGQALSQRLYQEIESLVLPIEPPACDTYLVQCSFNEKLTYEHERLYSMWKIAPNNLRRLVVEPFWHSHTPSDYAALAAALMEVTLP